MKYLLLLFLAVSSITLNAAETVVQGNIKAYNGKTVKAAVIANYISNSKQYLSEYEIKDNQYRLSFDIDQSRELIIKIEDKEAVIFVEPGALYNINLSYDEEKNRGKAYNKVLDVEFSYPKANELNQIIRSFNKAYGDFMHNNYRLFVTQQAKDEVEKFVKEQSKISLYQQNDYAENYVRYALADLQLSSNASKRKLFEKYLKNKDILYLQKEYMNFYKQFYQKSFESLSLSSSGTAILKAIILEENLEKGIQLIKDKEGFEQDALAELYLIYGLFDVYHQDIIKKENSLMLLDLLSKNASNEKNKATAKSVAEKLKTHQKGQLAPSFSLKNEKGEVKTLEDFRGEPIYLGFWANWSVPSLKQLKVIEKLESQYGEKIHFISINLDDDPQIMKDLLAQNNYSWTFLHYGNDYEIRENYNVLSVPTYYLIDENGKIVDANTFNPTAVEGKLYQLSK